MTPRADTLKAMIHSARWHNKAAVRKRQWAAEAERHGKPETAAKWRLDAMIMRTEAVWLIRKAQDEYDKGTRWPD